VFGFPEVSVGLGVTGGISRLLPLTVGMAKAKELVLLGERFSAAQALELGLINWVADEGKHLHSAMDVAARLRDKPRAALARAKVALNLGLEVGLEACTASKLIAWCLTWGSYDQLRCLVVLVDHTAEHFTSLDWQVQRWAGLAVLVGRPLLAGLVRAVPVVVGGVLAED
jgi:hypothetical protein